MRTLRRATVITAPLALAVALGLAGCSSDEEDATAAAAEPTTRTVSTNQGEVEVPAEPVRVAALDNTSFATLKAMGVEPVAVPKELLPATGYEDWAADEAIADVGTHREPDFEALNAAEPDLIVGGYRFADHYDELTRIAPTIDVAPSADAEGGFVQGLETQTRTLGEVLGATDVAQQLVDALQAAEQEAADATGTETVFLASLTGGHVDNGTSRLAPLLEPLELQNVLPTQDEATAVHNDSGLAPETIAQLNPDWMILMDRDAAVGTEGAPAAQQVVAGQQAWAQTTFVKEDQIVYLPSDFYVTEGIQTYTAVYEQIADAFSAA